MNGTGNAVAGGDLAVPFPPVVRVVRVKRSSFVIAIRTVPSLATASGAARRWKSCASGGLTPSTDELVRFEYQTWRVRPSFCTASRNDPFSCSTTSSSSETLEGLLPRAQTDVALSIFSRTMEKSLLSGDTRVTTDPPFASIPTPAPCLAKRHPGGANCDVWAMLHVGEVISYAPLQGWLATATPQRDQGR